MNEALYTIENKLWASVLVRRFSCATLPPIYYFAPPSVPSGCTGLDKDWLDSIGWIGWIVRKYVLVFTYKRK